MSLKMQSLDLPWRYTKLIVCLFQIVFSRVMCNISVSSTQLKALKLCMLFAIKSGDKRRVVTQELASDVLPRHSLFICVKGGYTAGKGSTQHPLSDILTALKASDVVYFER